MFRKTAEDGLVQEIRHQEDAIKYWLLIFKTYIHDRGYIQEGPCEDLLRVHPLFTIIGRVFLSEIISISNRVKMRMMFCASLEALAFQQGASKVSGSANTLTSLKFCFFEVPMDSWPIARLGACFYQGSGHMPLVLQDLLQDKCVELLCLIPRKLPLLERRKVCNIFLCCSLFSALLGPLQQRAEVAKAPAALRDWRLSPGIRQPRNRYQRHGSVSHILAVSICGFALLFREVWGES